MMETKPYNLQSPEQIAKDYGGNKQRIAEAMQMGIVDPTAGVLAGMFIDRMRMAQQQEMAPQQTVAQQVFTPPAPPAPPMGAMPPAAAMPPAGLGATPEAAAMGAPPPPQMMAPPAPPMEEAPVGMAAGGLTTLPVPDGMFDEPDVGGYAAGGLVAFANGGSTTEPEPDAYYGYNFRDPTANLAVRDRLFGAPQTRYADEAEQDFLRRRSPEERRLQRRRDLGQLLAEAGFGMMSGTSPNALQNIGAAMLPALSSANERARERRAEEREIQRGLLDIEAGRNTAAAQRATQALSMQEMGIRGYESATDRRVRAEEAELNRAFQREEREDQQRFQLGLEGLRARSGGGGGGRAAPQLTFAEANVTIPGAQTRRGGRAPNTVIERYRVRFPNSTQFGYQFPELGGMVVNSRDGADAMGVVNLARYAEHIGVRVDADRDGNLVGVYPDGTVERINRNLVRRLSGFGPSYNPGARTYVDSSGRTRTLGAVPDSVRRPQYLNR